MASWKRITFVMVFLGLWALWPSAVKAGEPDDDLPKMTGAFAAYCGHEDHSHKTTCEDIITTGSLAAMLKDPNTICIPDALTETDDDMTRQIATVTKWLKDHKELAAQARNTSIVAAYHALYPCQKP